VIRDRTKWSNGLHQFLELKHGLEVSAQEIVSKFMSNLALYDKYQYLYGLTGTLGIRESKSYFHGIYKVNIMAIPPDKKRILQHRNGTAWKQE
jgi:preprotein translocase subunit SecA